MSRAKRITLERLRKADFESAQELYRIARQLSASTKPLTLPALRKVVQNKNIHLWVVRAGKEIVGMGSLVVWHMPSGVRSRVEDVVVDEQYRGKGLGKKLMRKLIAVARQEKVRDIKLSTRVARYAANALYKKLGFEQKDTNVYSLDIQGKG